MRCIRFSCASFSVRLRLAMSRSSTTFCRVVVSMPCAFNSSRNALTLIAVTGVSGTTYFWRTGGSSAALSASTPCMKSAALLMPACSTGVSGSPALTVVPCSLLGMGVDWSTGGGVIGLSTIVDVSTEGTVSPVTGSGLGIPLTGFPATGKTSASGVTGGVAGAASTCASPVVGCKPILTPNLFGSLMIAPPMICAASLTAFRSPA